MSLNNEQNCREISKDKIAVCEKTAGLRSGSSSDLNSACLKALVSVEIFQFSDMHYESRFLDTFREDNISPIIFLQLYLASSIVHNRARNHCVVANIIILASSHFNFLMIAVLYRGALGFTSDILGLVV